MTLTCFIVRRRSSLLPHAWCVRSALELGGSWGRAVRRRSRRVGLRDEETCDEGAVNCRILSGCGGAGGANLGLSGRHERDNWMAFLGRKRGATVEGGGFGRRSIGARAACPSQTDQRSSSRERSRAQYLGTSAAVALVLSAWDLRAPPPSQTPRKAKSGGSCLAQASSITALGFGFFQVVARSNL